MSKVKNREQRKHIELHDYLFKMIEFDSGEMIDEKDKELEEDIKTWELFRINCLIGLSNYDVDGIPTPLLQKKLKDCYKTDFSGGDESETKKIFGFSITQFTPDEDEKKLHSSQGHKYKNEGEKYRTLEHQHLMFRIHYKER